MHATKKLQTLRRSVLPCLAAFSASLAQAANSLEIYGTIDMGYTLRSNHLLPGVKHQNAINSGTSDGNRLGFRGTEDLGAGYKVFLDLETGFWADTGDYPAPRLFNRQAYLGVSGAFGSLLAGRQYAPSFILEATLDPFGANTVGNYRNVFQNIAAVQQGESQFDPTRIDNAIQYASPRTSGFSVNAMAAFNALGQEGSLPKKVGGSASVDNKGDARFLAILPSYQNGPVHVMALYQQTRSAGNIAQAEAPRFTKWAIGGAYDFGVVRLSAFHDHNKLKTKSAAQDGLTLRNWMLGASLPFGKHAMQISLARSRLADVSGNTGIARQIALGYTYHFSRRTNAYAVFSDIDNNSKRRGILGAPAIVFDADNLGNGYQRAFQFGLLHRF
ncbi:MAG: porin [Zoogloeaceae bacterium]|nr:porin [Zoogloeaceae bacterium]